MTVVILEDAAADIESGRQFYETREPGVSEYFVEAILADLASLVCTPAFTLCVSVFIGCCPSAFRSAFTMRLNARQLSFTRFWTCGGTRFGSTATAQQTIANKGTCAGRGDWQELHAGHQWRRPLMCDVRPIRTLCWRSRFT